MIITTSRPSMSANISARAWLSAPAFFSRVADRREDFRSAPPRDIGGVVGAVVGHDHHLLRTSRLPPQRLQRRSDRQALVMRRHQHGQAQRLLDEIRGVRVRELAGGQLRLVDEPDRRRAQRSQHQACATGASPATAQPESAGRGRARASPPPRAERPEPRRHRPRRRRRPESARRTERCRRRRAEAGRRCPSGSSRSATHAASTSRINVEPDQRNCEKAQPSHSPTARKLIDHRHRRTVSRSLDGADDEMASARRHHRGARGARAWPTREQAVVE